MERIGDHLVATGRISAEQLRHALQRQRTEGGFVGQHLVLAGAVGRRELYDALASLWEIPTRDLVAQPPDPRLVATLELEELAELDWVPCELTEDGTVVVATTVRPTAEIVDQIVERFPRRGIAFVTCTRWDVDRAAARVHRDRLLHLAEGQPRRRRPVRPHPGGATGVHFATIGLVLGSALLAVLLAPAATFVTAALAAAAVFLLAICFQAAAGVRAVLLEIDRRQERRVEARERQRRGLPQRSARRDGVALPVYTVLVPVSEDPDAVAKVVQHLGAVDYPKSRLDVVVLIDEDDAATLEAAKSAAPPEWVRLLVVPRAGAASRTRSCNYGLAFARGQFVVVYDAGDQPEPGQLRAAVSAFEHDMFEHLYRQSSRPRLACVQAGRTVLDRDRTLLTRMSAIDESHWYDGVLPGLDGTGTPLPLSVTSAHFDVRILRRVGAWDASVVDGADLGLRATVDGYRVGVLASTTGHQAYGELRPWLDHRIRATVGLLRSAAVTFRHPVALVRNVGRAGLLGLVALVLGAPLAYLAYPLVLAATATGLVDAALTDRESSRWVAVGGTTALLVGLAVMIVAGAVTAGRRHGWSTAALALLLPVHWLLHSIAAWSALITVSSPTPARRAALRGERSRPSVAS